MCKAVIQVAMARLRDPALRRTLESDISDACDSMPAEQQVWVRGRAGCEQPASALQRVGWWGAGQDVSILVCMCGLLSVVATGGG
jgi:hypothetical protein